MSEKLSRRSALAASVAGLTTIATASLTEAGDKKRRQQCCCQCQQPVTNCCCPQADSQDVRGVRCAIYMFGNFGNGIYGYYTLLCPSGLSPQAYYGPAMPYGANCTAVTESTYPPSCFPSGAIREPVQAKRKVRFEKRTGNPDDPDDDFEVPVEVFSNTEITEAARLVTLDVVVPWEANNTKTLRIYARIGTYKISDPRGDLTEYIGQEIIKPKNPVRPLNAIRVNDYEMQYVDGSTTYKIHTHTKLSK